MKYQTQLIIALAAGIILAVLVAISFPGALSLAQESPVPTPTAVVGEPPAPPDPVPIPPTLLELIKQLFTEVAGWLTGLVLLGLGIAQKWLVTNVRKWFANDKGTATKINGGVAELVAALTSIGTALIAFVLTWAIGFVSGLDVVSLLELAGVTYLSGFGVHKVYKVGRKDRVLKATAQ